MRNTKARAAVYSAVAFAFFFATLAAAVVARRAAAAATSEGIQPFVAWLPNQLSTALIIVAVLAALAAALMFLLLVYWQPITRVLHGVCGRDLRLSWTKRSVITAAVVLFVFWLPIAIVAYPTGYTQDTFNQLYQFQTQAPTYYASTGEMLDAEYSDHHPVFTTLLYGVFWSAGMAFGSQNVGLFALALLQCVVLALELAALVCYLDKLGISWPVRFAALIFFAWFPFFGRYASTVLKDVTYLTFFVPWLLMWFEAFYTRGQALVRVPFLLAFVLLSGGCILAKKLGLFLLVPCLVVAFFALREQRVRIAGAGISCVLVFALALPAVVFPAIGGVAPGGRQEAIGFAIQQFISVARETPSAISAEDRAALQGILDIDAAIEDFEAFRADGAKGHFKSQATTAEVLRFVGIWAKVGLQHPVAYAKAIAYTSGMLYIPYMKMTYYYDNDFSKRTQRFLKADPNFNVVFRHPQALKDANDYLEFHSIEAHISDLPVVSLFFTTGFWGGWMPFVVLLLVLYARGKGVKGTGVQGAAGVMSASGAEAAPDARPASAGSKATQSPSGARIAYIAALAPLVVSVLLLPLSPVASPRYVLPLLFGAPLFLAWAAAALSHQEDELS